MRRFLSQLGFTPALLLVCACSDAEHVLGSESQPQSGDSGSREPDAEAPSTGGASGSSPETADAAAADAGSDGGGSSGPSAIVPCPGGASGPAPESDPLDVQQFSIQGDTLAVDVTYGGGCGEHAFSLCYGGVGASLPPHVGVYVIHDSSGDTCDSAVQRKLVFDLKPLHEVGGSDGLLNVSLWYRNDEGTAVSAGATLYRFGALSCWERTFLADRESRDLEAPSRECATAEDCRWVSIETPCSFACGTIASAAAAAELEPALQRIGEEICGDFDGDGCELPTYGACIGTAAEPASLACVDGVCVAGP